jgi:hypothetical protein
MSRTVNQLIITAVRSNNDEHLSWRKCRAHPRASGSRKATRSHLTWSSASRPRRAIFRLSQFLVVLGALRGLTLRTCPRSALRQWRRQPRPFRKPAVPHRSRDVGPPTRGFCAVCSQVWLVISVQVQVLVCCLLPTGVSCCGVATGQAVVGCPRPPAVRCHGPLLWRRVVAEGSSINSQGACPAS